MSFELNWADNEGWIGADTLYWEAVAIDVTVSGAYRGWCEIVVDSLGVGISRG